MSATKLANFILISPEFGYGEPVPGDYAYRGGNKSPDLRWHGAPEGTETYALIVEDADSKGFCHWAVFNIPKTTNTLPGRIKKQNLSTVAMTQGTNDFGNIGWDGPDPPRGTHRYYFRLYALDTRLDLDESAGCKEVKKAMEGHILAATDHMGTHWK